MHATTNEEADTSMAEGRLLFIVPVDNMAETMSHSDVVSAMIDWNGQSKNDHGQSPPHNHFQWDMIANCLTTCERQPACLLERRNIDHG